MREEGNYVVVLSREDYDLVKLRQVCQEVVDTRPLGSSPAVLSLCTTLVSYGSFESLGSTHVPSGCHEQIV